MSIEKWIFQKCLAMHYDNITSSCDTLRLIDKTQNQLCETWRHTIYRQTSNITPTLVGNEIVDHSDVVGASPVGAAPTTSSFST